MPAHSATNVTPSSSVRDAESTLLMTEAERTAVRCGTGEATRLRPAPAALLAHVARLGLVKARSASRHATLESIGTYGAPDIGEHTGIVIGENIDLRIFPSGWADAYAVVDETDGADSLQIFDDEGAATHAIVLRPESNARAYETLVAELATVNDAPPIAFARAEPRTAKDDAEVDVTAYRGAFAAMRDTHDFFMLLRRFGLVREQGLRLADAAFARPLARHAHRHLFSRATVERIPLMLFVANEGIVHISSGLVPAATGTGPTYGIRDSHFSLRVNEDGVARAWAVRKPTVNGIVTSLELYDAAGTLIVQVFGERHEGSGERPDWARAIAELPSL